jgi:hypothetical protein
VNQSLRTVLHRGDVNSNMSMTGDITTLLNVVFEGT